MSTLATLVAVGGTLAGSTTTAFLHARAARAQRADTHRRARMDDALSAVADLVTALADHRRTMWTLGDLTIGDADSDTLAAAVTDTHTTRSAITGPLTRLRILAPQLDTVAEAAAQATYRMRGTRDAELLQAQRRDAIATADAFVAAARDLFPDLRALTPPRRRLVTWCRRRTPTR